MPSLSLIATPAVADDYWPELKSEIWGDRAVAEADGRIVLDTPERAQQAAYAPVTITTDPKRARLDPITKVTLLLERNPAPVVAEVELAPEIGLADLSTRVRVNENQNMRVVAETASGKLYMDTVYVKGAGGCAEGGYPTYEMGPSAKQGDMQFESEIAVAAEEGVSVPLTGLRKATLRVRHPNHSGFMRDPIAMHYIPAMYVDEMAVTLDDAPLLKLTGSISMSQNPTLGFHFLPGEASALQVTATDTGGDRYETVVPVGTRGKLTRRDGCPLGLQSHLILRA